MNQKAMFEHLSFLLDNATMLLARPSLRGSVPLDVAYSSFMDNNELALALKEEELDKVTIYLSRCGLQVAKAFTLWRLQICALAQLGTYHKRLPGHRLGPGRR